MATIATLGGEHLPITQRVGWTIRTGTRPAMRYFQLPLAAAERLLTVARDQGTVDLVVHPEGLDELLVTRLSPLSIHASQEHPDLVALLVADRRWLWQRQWIHRAYNMRRRTGERRILQEGGIPDALAVIEDDVHFAPWSLAPRDNPTQEWTARQIVEDILETLVPGEWEIDASLTRTLDVEDVVIDDIGPSAALRALGRIVGDGLYVRPEDAKVMIYDMRNHAEEAVVASAGPPIAGLHLARKLDLSAIRPQRVKVLITPEIELRIDSVIEGGTTLEDVREMINVAPVPDFTLVVGGRTLPQGTWVSIDELFAAWNANPRPTDIPIAWSHTLIQQTWYLPHVLQVLVQGGGVDPDPIAERRLATIMSYYRQTYRIDRKFIDRIAKLSHTRVGILDDELGVRAPAVAYSGWTEVFNRRAGAADIVRISRFVNSVDGYAALLADARVAPAKVTVLDGDQGIVRITYQLDPDGRLAYVAPGLSQGRAIGNNELPEADPRREAADDLGTMAQDCRLSSGHRVAVVLTMQPAAPNDRRRLHEVTVEPGDVFPRLGLGTPACLGPEWFLRVRPGLETARWAWQDDLSDEVDELLGIAGSPDGAGTAALGDPLNIDRVRELAISSAAALYARMVDRIEGQLNVAWSPEILPVGSIAAIEHVLNPDGSAITSIALPDEIDIESQLSTMEESVRRQMLGLVSREAGVTAVTQ